MVSRLPSILITAILRLARACRASTRLTHSVGLDKLFFFSYPLFILRGYTYFFLPYLLFPIMLIYLKKSYQINLVLPRNNYMYSRESRVFLSVILSESSTCLDLMPQYCSKLQRSGLICRYKYLLFLFLQKC